MQFDDYYYDDQVITPYGRGGDVQFGTNDIIGAGVLMGFFSILALYGLVVWIMRSIGLYHLAKDRGIAHAWFAWIPILHLYILGRLDNNKVVLGDSIVTKHAEFFLPFLSLLALSAVPSRFIAGILGVSVWVYEISAYWRLFKIYKPKSRVSYTIWSAILGPGFFVFAIRNERPYDPLEPDKVYENFYGHKRVVQDQYDEMEAEIRRREGLEKAKLRDMYENQIKQPGLTEEERDQIEHKYFAERNRIENAAERLINEKKTEERADIFELDKNKAEEVDETDVYNKPENKESTKETGNVIIEKDVYFTASEDELGETENISESIKIVEKEDE